MNLMHGQRKKQKTDWGRKRRDGMRYDGGGNPVARNGKPKQRWHENTDGIPDEEYQNEEFEDRK